MNDDIECRQLLQEIDLSQYEVRRFVGLVSWFVSPVVLMIVSDGFRRVQRMW